MSTNQTRSMHGSSSTGSMKTSSFQSTSSGGARGSGSGASRSFHFQNLSKLMLPPLGISRNQPTSGSDRWIVSPLGSRYRCWETFMVILAAYSAWVYPFEVAFMGASPKGGLEVADMVVDAFFTVDIVLAFFVAYIDSRTQLLVRDRKRIAFRYLSTFFIMDVASTIPFQGLAYLVNGEAREGMVYSLLVLLRLWRLRKFQQFFPRLEKDIRFSYFWIRCARLIAVTLLLVHGAGCLYYLLADRYPDRGKTWIGAVTPNFRQESLWIRYITTMSTVGHGDLHAQNNLEMIFNIFYMLFNLGLAAYLSGNMTNLAVEGTRRTMEFRNSIRAASNFLCRNELPPRLRQQILAYMCLKFKADSLNQQQLMDQLPKSICKSISDYLFHNVVSQVYLFNGITMETLRLLVTKTKPEYIPPKDEVVVQNQAADDVYIIVSGEVEMMYLNGLREEVVGTLGTSDIFGEVSALSDRPETFTFRTRTLCQLLALKQATFREVMQSKPDDSAVIMRNFLKHQMEAHDMKELLGESGGEGGSGNTIPCSLLTVAATGNSSFLEDLLKLGLDPNIGDSKGRTALHIAASKGYDDCVQALLSHGCNVNIKDAEGNTALWQAIAAPARHHKVFSSLYHAARVSNPRAGGDLLCLAARRGDLGTLRELLKHGLDVDSEDHDGATALRVALSEGQADVARFLVTNGASLDEDGYTQRQTTTVQVAELRELVERREVGHLITIRDSPAEADTVTVVGSSSGELRQGRFPGRTGSASTHWPRVSIYKGHPFVRNHSSEAGKLINLPATTTMEELKTIIGGKLKVGAGKALVLNDEGLEIDSVDVIRDKDKLFIVTEEHMSMLASMDSAAALSHTSS